MPSQRSTIDIDFQVRRDASDQLDPNDLRKPYQIDRTRVIHSSAFRRLQGKTQVMGVGEGDFHRTRLTHSIEVSQVGIGLLQPLWKKLKPDKEVSSWIPGQDLVLSACLAHDLGHPPFGHGGEKALYSKMKVDGGFEGNGQTLRLLSRLEKCRSGFGINPTRRLVLSILKYPVPYGRFNLATFEKKPPKCYLDNEQEVVDWALEPFSASDRELLLQVSQNSKPLHRTLDCSIMECADDVAYAVHDLEDIVARKFVTKEQLLSAFRDKEHLLSENGYTIDQFEQNLFASGSCVRRQFIERLVWDFVSAVDWKVYEDFEHPLLRYRAYIPSPCRELLDFLQDLTLEQVVRKAFVQQLEIRGQRIVVKLFEELLLNPESLIPPESWNNLPENDTLARRVCDYVAGMTNSYAEKIYNRLFTPGFGSSRDEL